MRPGFGFKVGTVGMVPATANIVRSPAIEIEAPLRTFDRAPIEPVRPNKGPPVIGLYGHRHARHRPSVPNSGPATQTGLRPRGWENGFVA